MGEFIFLTNFVHTRLLSDIIIASYQEKEFDDITADPGWFFETARCVYSPLIETQKLQVRFLLTKVSSSISAFTDDFSCVQRFLPLWHS